MVDPIALMMDEHRLIEKGLAALESYANQVEGMKIEDGKADLGKMAEFIREFADRTHHGKEEEILFEEMNQNGFSKEECPLSVMYTEHDQGRSHVRQLKAYAEQMDPWSEQDRQGVVSHARAFVMLLRLHIQKEDNILYPLAQQKLPPEVMNTVASRSAEFEEKERSNGENQRLRKLGVDLHAKYCD